MTVIGKSKLTAAAALLASAVMTSASVAAPAVSPAATDGVSKATSTQIQQVRDWRGHRGGWRHHGGRGWGWGAGAAAAGLLLTAPLWAGAYDNGYYDDGYGSDYAYEGNGADRCEATFRSFDPATGTYMGYDGIRRPCPYL